MSEAIPQAKAYANRALEIDDSLSEAHAALAYINQVSWNWAESEKEYKRAIELDSNNPLAHSRYSTLLQVLGRFDESLAENKRASELDQLEPYFVRSIAIDHLLRGELDLAVEYSKKARELDPNSPTWLAWIYLKQGRNDEALAEAQKRVQTSRNSISLSWLGSIQARLGNRNEALAIIKELDEKYARREVDEFDIALVYAGLGDNDKAFGLLEKAFQDRDVFYGFKIHPGFEPLRNDPRFKDLLKRMNLPE